MRRMAMKSLWLFIFGTILVTAHALTVEAPAKEIQVARGKNVTLRCHFKTEASIHSGDVVVWRKINSADDAVTRYFDGLVQYGTGYENRIQFSGDVNQGDISITINAVTMEDNGTYTCNVRLRNDPPRQTATLSLFVLVAPSKPECQILGTPEYGQTINLTCISHEGSPKPRYTWQSFNVQNEPRVLQTTEARSTTTRLLSGVKANKSRLWKYFPSRDDSSPTGRWYEKWLHHSCFEHKRAFRFFRTATQAPIFWEQITLKNISADTSGFYICTSTNIVGKESCNMTVSVVPPSMNIALYAGIIGGAIAAIIVIGILAYCCCCRAEKDKDYEMTEQEDRNEPSNKMPTRNQRAEEDY